MVLAAFLVGLALSLAGLVFAVARGFGLWRQAKSTGSRFETELAAIEAKSARTEQLLAASELKQADLQAALERLRVSRARLSVLTQSLERSKTRTRWLRAFLPG